MALEEGGRAARTFMESMKEQPLSLALVVMNLCLLGYLYYAAIVAAKERSTELALLYENRKYVTDVLASCIHVDDVQKLLKGHQ